MHLQNLQNLNLLKRLYGQTKYHDECWVRAKLAKIPAGFSTFLPAGILIKLVSGGI